MKKSTLLSALFCGMLVWTGSAQANTFTGTIDGVITSVDNLFPSVPGTSPWYVGEHLTGSYAYVSPTIDGTFVGGQQMGTPGYPLLTPQDFYGGIQLGNFQTGFGGYPINWNSILTVQGGLVTYMDVDGEQGLANWYFYADHFELRFPILGGPSWDITGTMTLSPPSPVPEAPSFAINASWALLPLVFHTMRRLRSRK
jgi:hypothetical protein